MQVAPSLAATEHRGITLQQLRALVAEIDRHADAEGYLPGWTDRHGKTCHKDTIGLYAAVLACDLNTEYSVAWDEMKVKTFLGPVS